LCPPRGDAYLAQTRDNPNRLQLDPMGDQPGYGGDTDLAYTGCSIGLGMGVFPQLVITHLIPSRRSTLDYLLRNLEAHEYSHVLQNYYRSGALPPAPTLRQRIGRNCAGGEVMRSSARSSRPRIAAAHRRGRRSQRAATAGR
jgi:hypothetical protein